MAEKAEQSILKNTQKRNYSTEKGLVMADLKFQKSGDEETRLKRISPSHVVH